MANGAKQREYMEYSVIELQFFELVKCSSNGIGNTTCY